MVTWLKRQGAGRGLILLLCLCAPFLSGCGTLFSSYPSQIDPVLARLRADQPVDPGATFDERTTGALNGLLWTMEKARTAQIQAQYGPSLQAFDECMARIQTLDDRAVVTLSGVAQQGGAVVVNDNMIPYRPEGYERVMVHHCQAVNYLLTGDLDACVVEIRRANFEQNQALERHNKELARAKKKSEEQNVDTGEVAEKLRRAYAGMDEVAGQVKSSFQNAYTFYLSGVCYEIRGNLNDAYIDYRKALEIVPGNEVVQRDVVRLAARLGMADHLRELQQRFPAAAAHAAPNAPGSDAADIVVFFEDGFVPRKEEIKLPIPIIGSSGLHGLTMVAFPYYRVDWRIPAPLSVSVDGAPGTRTEPVCSLTALAVKALKEKIPQLALRQALRTVAKGVAAKVASDRAGALGAITMSLANVITENADTRSWSTLPGNVQIVRTRVNAGLRSVDLSHSASGASTTVTLELGDGQTALVWVTRAGTTMYVKQAVF
jgi:hypothetical protein